MAGNEEDMHHMRGGSRQQLIVEPTMEEFAMSAPTRQKSRSRNAPATSPAQNLENVSDPLGLGILFRRDSRNQLKVTALFPGSDIDNTGLIGMGDILYVRIDTQIAFFESSLPAGMPSTKQMCGSGTSTKSRLSSMNMTMEELLFSRFARKMLLI